MKLCRFDFGSGTARVGLSLEDATVLDLSAEVQTLAGLLEAADFAEQLAALAKHNWPRHALSDVRLLPPVDQQEVWAAGVTYLRSKKARMAESDFSASAYDRVYEAPRPELFFKSLPEKVVGPGDAVGIRTDSKWSVPEPELVLVLNSRGELRGFTIGNDMSSRDIEGENLLYLPQAKIYERSCALGPCILPLATEAEARQWEIRLTIKRAGQPVFSGVTSVNQIKRSFTELTGYLFRSQKFPRGVMLFTGTGLVPPDQFTLQPADRVVIQIHPIGILENLVVAV